MTDEDYASKIVIQDTSVGHWDDLGEIARNEDGTLHLKSRTLE